MARSERRWKMLHVSTEFLLFPKGEEIVCEIFESDIPAGARIVQAAMEDSPPNTLQILVEHESFPPVPLGARPGTLTGPIFRRNCSEVSHA